MGQSKVAKAARELTEAADEVLQMALEVERDPGSSVRIKYLCDAVREWKSAGQRLHDAQVEAGERKRMRGAAPLVEDRRHDPEV
jgi:hypothetical protein